MKLTQQARECTRWRNKFIFKVALTVNKSLGTMHYAEVQGYSEELVRNYLSREASPREE